MLPSRNDACWILDPEAGLTPNNLFVDSGPHGLHMTPFNFAAPNYGIVALPSGAKAIQFASAALTRIALPLNYYTYAPTIEFTFVMAFEWTVAVGIFTRWFNEGDGNNGMNITYNGGIEYRALSGGTTAYPRSNAVLSTKMAVFIGSSNVTGITGIRRCWKDGSWDYNTAAGSIAAITHLPATVPTIGSAVGGGVGHISGNVAYMALWPRLFSNQEAADITAMLRDRL